MRWYQVALRLLFIYYISGVLMSPPPSIHHYNPDFHVYCDKAAVEEGLICAHSGTAPGSDCAVVAAVSALWALRIRACDRTDFAQPADRINRRLIQTTRLLL